MKKRLKTYIFALAITLSAPVCAQDNALTLEESISVALEHNPDFRSSELAVMRSEVQFRGSWGAFLPQVSGNYNIGKSNGRSIDPFTNTYINQDLTFSNASLNLEASVFNAFRLWNLLRQDRLNLKAAQLEREEARQNLVLNVTLAYLQVLNNRDLVQLAENRLETTSEQLDRLRTLFDEGVGNPADFTDIQGQFAMDRNTLVLAESTLEESLVAYNTLLNSEESFIPEEIPVPVVLEQYPFTAEHIYEQALGELPGHQAQEIRVEAAKNGLQAARGLYFPSVSLFASLNTNYSSAAEIFNEVGTRRIETGDFIDIDGEEIPVMSEQLQFEPAPIPYRDQFENNLNSVVGVALTIPIFNGFSARNTVALQKIDLKESVIALENERLQLEQAIKESYIAMEAAYERYHNLVEQVEAYEESFRVYEIRFNSGVSNMVEYTISRNTLENARINLANAKYEYLLRTRILEYYRGEGLMD